MTVTKSAPQMAENASLHKNSRYLRGLEQATCLECLLSGKSPGQWGFFVSLTDGPPWCA